MRVLAKSAPNHGNTRKSHDVVGEYAVYMIDGQACLKAREKAFSRGLAGSAKP
jgi:hypothetical protein